MHSVHKPIQVQTDFQFGNQELLKLCAKYNHFLTKNGDDTKHMLIKEYNEFKFILNEKIKYGTLKTFSDVVSNGLAEDKFSNLATLLDICGTFQASSADAERGFSLMNTIKTKSRNRLEADHLDILLRIKFYLTSGQNIDLEAVYLFLKSDKNRRQKRSDIIIKSFAFYQYIIV